MQILSEFGPESECTCKMSTALIQNLFTWFTLGLDPWILSGKACRFPVPWQRCRQLLPPCGSRVSIPRSALLPAYKYKAHRRRSFEPADDLALPSVSCCLPVDGTAQAGPCFIARRKENLGLIPLAVSTKIFEMRQ